MPRGRAANYLMLKTPGRGSSVHDVGGDAEISLAWQGPRRLLPGKASLFALGIAAAAAAVWSIGISNSVSALNEAWSSLQPKWHFIRPAMIPAVRPAAVSPGPAAAFTVAEPDVPAATTVAPVDAISTNQSLSEMHARTHGEGGALTILTSTAIESSDGAVGIQALPETSREAERQPNATAAAAVRQHRSTTSARRDTSWTGSFF